MQESRVVSRQRLGRLCLTVGVAVVSTLVVVHFFGDQQFTHAQPPAPRMEAERPAPALTEMEMLSAEGLSRVFRTAAQKALPAVVVIKAGATPVCPRCGRAHELDDEDAVRTSRSGHQKSFDLLGSGFIVDPKGIVLTNKHVVSDRRRMVVQTADGKQFPVKNVTTDDEHDVAVLTIESPTALPFVALGDSDAAAIGNWVLTIGCPLELEQTVSAGIISAKNRSFCPTHPTRYLQTDAVVNPGSSGGPLVALNGTVIGITTSIASEDGGYQGIGFAIPASVVKPLLEKARDRAAKAAATDAGIR